MPRHNLSSNSETDKSLYVDIDENIVLGSRISNGPTTIVPSLNSAGKINLFSEQSGGWRDMVGQISFVGTDITADCHYQSDTFNTLNRQPNFYGT